MRVRRRVVTPIALVALALAAASARPSRAAQGPPPANTLTIEPLAAILTRTISLEYERALTDDVTLYLAPSFTFDSVASGGEDASFVAVGGALGARIFLWSPAPTGLFISPFVQVAWAEAERGAARGSGLGFAAGALFGHTWLLGRLFDLSVGIGAAYWALTVRVDGADEGLRGVHPAARAAVGVAF